MRISFAHAYTVPRTIPTLLVDVPVGVGLAVMWVLMLVLGMLVVVCRVRVSVLLATVLVLVGVRGSVGVFVAHYVPVIRAHE